MRDIFGIKVAEYCEAHSTKQDEVLRALERETHLGTVTPQMIAGEYQGKLLEMLTRMKAPKRAIELGTFTGYSAICIARGLPDGALCLAGPGLGAGSAGPGRADPAGTGSGCATRDGRG